MNELTSELVGAISYATYPEYMNFWDEENVLDDEFMKRDVMKYSFLLYGSTWLGFCVAFLMDPPDADRDKTLYVCDIAVLPGVQGKGYGEMMAAEVFRRAVDDGIKKIEFHARETTTYQIIMGSTAASRVIGDSGYRLVDHHTVVTFPENEPIERGHHFSIER